MRLFQTTKSALILPQMPRVEELVQGSVQEPGN